MKAVSIYVCVFLLFVTMHSRGDATFEREYPELPHKLTSETPEQKAERLAWWTDARFGMFIHFGLYSVPAGVGEQGATDLGEWI